RSRELVGKTDETSSAKLVDEVIGAAAARQRGVVGLEPTLEALIEGRVQKLVVSTGFSHEGSSCRKCGYFAAKIFERCPACGGAGEPTDDIVERALERAVPAGASFDIIADDAAEALRARGGIGALLRY